MDLVKGGWILWVKGGFATDEIRIEGRRWWWRRRTEGGEAGGEKGPAEEIRESDGDGMTEAVVLRLTTAWISASGQWRFVARRRGALQLMKGRLRVLG